MVDIRNIYIASYIYDYSMSLKVRRMEIEGEWLTGGHLNERFEKMYMTLLEMRI